MKAYLILEDGNVFEGESVGADKEVVSEFSKNAQNLLDQEYQEERDAYN